MRSDEKGAVASEDREWRPSGLEAWWAGLPPVPRGWLRKRLNPDNQTRLHLAKLVARRPGQFVIGPYTYCLLYTSDAADD